MHDCPNVIFICILDTRQYLFEVNKPQYIWIILLFLKYNILSSNRLYASDNTI